MKVLLKILVLVLCLQFNSYGQTWNNIYGKNDFKDSLKSEKAPTLDDSSNKVVTSAWVKSNIHGSYIGPTLQQVLQVGSSLNQNNTIYGGRKILNFTGNGSFNISIPKSFGAFYINDSASNNPVLYVINNSTNFQTVFNSYGKPVTWNAFSVFSNVSKNVMTLNDTSSAGYGALYDASESYGYYDTFSTKRWVINRNYFTRTGDSASYINLPSETIATAFPVSGATLFDSASRWGYKTSSKKTLSFSTSKISVYANLIDSFPDYSMTFTGKYNNDTIFNKQIYYSTLNGSNNTVLNLPNSALTNNTISGVMLGGSLAFLTNGYGIKTMSYNGSGALSVTVDTVAMVTNANLSKDSLTLAAAINGKGRVDSIRLVNTGVIFTTPAAFSLNGSTGVITQTLATQSGYTVLQRGAGNGMPSFNVLDSNYFNGLWYRYIQGSISAGRGSTFINGVIGLDTTKNYTWTGNNVFGSSGAANLKTITVYKGTANQQIAFDDNGIYWNRATDGAYDAQITRDGSGGSTSLKYYAGSGVHNFYEGSTLYASFGNGTNTNVVAGGYLTVANIQSNGATLNLMSANNYPITLLSNDASGGSNGIIFNRSNRTAQGNNAISVWQYNGTEYGRFTTAGNMLIGTATDDGVNKLQVNGNIALKTAGNKISVATGTNASVGSATFGSGTGTVTLTNTCISSSSKVFVTITSVSGTTYGVYQRGTTGSSSMVINSLTPTGSVNTLDNSTFDYWIIN